MDTGNKTLAQLSEEGKEARYVTLEVGAKISGYTKDYLERLCRLHKVNYLERDMGEHVIELESLLKETQTILLSYEGLTFVDKSDLNAPAEAAQQKDVESAEVSRNLAPPQFSTPVPSFAQSGREESPSQKDVFSFTGRAIVSDANHHQQIKEKVISPPVPAPLPEKKKILAPVNGSILGEAAPLLKKEVKETPHAIHHVVHIPIAKDKVVTPQVNEEQVPKLIYPSSFPVDEWDARLLGKETTENTAHTETPNPTSSLSPYHPIVTSRDPRDHHENLPLFPPLIPKTKTVLLTHESPKALLAEGVHTEASHLLSPKVAAQEQMPVTADGSPLFGAADQKIAHTQRIQPNSPIPMMRVMPQVPMVIEEHHLVTPAGTQLLTKSLGFNIAFIALLVVSSYLLLSGSNVAGLNNYATLINKQIGAVVEALGKRGDAKTVEPEISHSLLQEPIFLPESMENYEFSDEVIVTEGNTPGTILIQPILNDEVGNATEFPSTSSSKR